MEPKRCIQCNRLLGKLEQETPVAATADGRKIIFHIKCPRCGRLNHIHLTYDKSQDN